MRFVKIPAILSTVPDLSTVPELKFCQQCQLCQQCQAILSTVPELKLYYCDDEAVLL